jgi:hypothetical protein
MSKQQVPKKNILTDLAIAEVEAVMDCEGTHYGTSTEEYIKLLKLIEIYKKQ